MRQAFLALVLCFSGAAGLAETPQSMTKPAAHGPDKAYMQKIMDQWSTLDTSHVAQFYSSGPHTFFDIAPLKYTSWADYQAGATQLLATYKSAKFTVNDDAEVHHHGDMAWASATVGEDAVLKNGKHEMATFRWTLVWENQGGKWLIVHEHVSQPMP